MNTYPMNTTQSEIEAVVAKLTAKGRETMTSVGRFETSYFDEGIVESSGIWGECITAELGHKSSGVMNRLRDLGLWMTTPAGEGDDSDWWALTALGADVANYLAGNLDWQVAAERIGLEVEAPVEEAPVEETPAEKDVTVTAKKGTKWTYIYVGGELVAEVRNDQVGTVIDFYMAK